jgi:integrase
VVGRQPDERVWPYKNRDAIYKLLARLCERAGVPRIHPHSLRATFGHVLRFERKVEVETIRQLYGHRDQKTTRIYIGADAVDMRSAVETWDRPRLPSSPRIPVGV